MKPRVYFRFSQLQQADVTGIKPAIRADMNANNVLRDDVPEECDSRYDTQPMQTQLLTCTEAYNPAPRCASPCLNPPTVTGRS